MFNDFQEICMPCNFMISSFRKIFRPMLFGILTILSMVTVNSCKKDDPRTILFLGDSLTEGFRLPDDKSYPSLLQQRLDREGIPVEILNGGHSGDKTGDALVRMDSIFAGHDGKIEVMIVFLGANDSFDAVDPSLIKSNLIDIFKKARRYNPQIEIYLMKFPALKSILPGYEKDFEAAFLEATARANVSVLPFPMLGVFGVPEMNQDDQVHPNIAGAKKMAANIYRICKDRNIF